MSDVVLNAITREEFGKKFVKRMRREEKIPGIYYSHKEKNIPLLFELKNIQQILGKEIGLFDLKVDNKKTKKCIIREIQFDPVSRKLLHLDVMGVKLTEKITVNIPIHLIGDALGVKEQGGILNQTLYELEVSCLPLDLPDHVDVNVSSMKVGDTVHVKDIKIDNVEILNEPEVVVVGIAIPRAVKEAEEIAPAIAEEEEAAEGKKGAEEAKNN